MARRFPVSRLILLLLCGSLSSAAARGATYLPLPDGELARGAPVIVRARVIGQETALETEGTEEIAVTRTGFLVLEVLKGSVPGPTLRVSLPGGTVGDVSTWVPGTPSFSPDGEVVLFLSPTAGQGADFTLTEFGLSAFDVVQDRRGQRFAVRKAFEPAEDDYLSGRPAPGEPRAGAERAIRDADSFTAGLAVAASGAGAIETIYAEPAGELRPSGVRPLWANIGGQEGSSSLYRWFWDTGASPAAIVSTVGTQSGLSDGSNGLASVANAVSQWASVAGARVLYSQSSGSAPVVVNLDVESRGSYWSAPMSCSTGGVIGLAGPGSASPAGSFKGDSGYYAVKSASVYMRKVTGGCYSYQTFRTAVLHELGHTLGLGHPDQGMSVHSKTTSADWASAVMVSTVAASRPSAPQPDDIQAILWYYGTGAAPDTPAAAFTVSPNPPRAGVSTLFTDASTGSPASWTWNFGDGTGSSLRNPEHVYAAGGAYTVTLTVSNNAGASTTTRQVTVSGCAAGAAALCLNGGRFRVQVLWGAHGSAAAGSAVPVSADTGYFWFFTPNNVELIVKVVDGRAFNNGFWVFYGALSDVEYTITVTDTLTGAVKSYFNPRGTLASVADTSAFAAAGPPADESKVQTGSGQSAPAAAGGGCGLDIAALCVNNSRFRVHVSWRVASQGTSGAGVPVGLTTDTGYFWFFSPNNIELVVKIVDGTSVNGRYWLFAGALSDVEYTITVTDLSTGAVRTYVNPSGSLASVADTSAF